jgi:predicted patatin/cPLA2 family phospholipase
MFTKVAGCKINTQKSLVFLYTSNEQSEEKNQENDTIHNSFKKFKYLGRNLTKEVKENYESLKKEIEEDVRKWKDIPGS